MQNLIGQYVTLKSQCHSLGKLIDIDYDNQIFYVEGFDSEIAGWSYSSKSPFKKSTKAEIEAGNTTQKQCVKAIVSIGAEIKAAQRFVEKTFGFLQERGLTQHECNAEMQKYIQSFA
jgi:hypothetical protein